MKKLSIVVNARLGSSRVQNKLTRPFGSSCLLRRALEKVNQLTFAHKRFLAIAEPELEKYVEGLDNIEILWREKDAVKKGDNPHSAVFAHYLKVPTEWIMVINPCLPFVSVKTYNRTFQEFQKNDYQAYTSAFMTRAWMFDSTGNPVTNKDPEVLSTKKGPYNYKVAHAFHIINRPFFASTGMHWEMTKDNPHLIEIPYEEALDVDTPLEFRINELLLIDGYPNSKEYYDGLTAGDSFTEHKACSVSPAKQFKIGKYNLTKDNHCFVVAEIGCSHLGNLEMAHRFLDVAAETGTDAAKFQTHIAKAESTPLEPFRVNFLNTNKSRFEYWQSMEFNEEQWRALKQHAEDLGLVFISSPFSIEAVDLLHRIGVKVWKIGSGEVTNLPMIQHICKTGLPVILSTGMSTWPEIDEAVELIKDSGNPLVLLQCTTEYPCRPENAGLNNIIELKKRYQVPVGFSSHSPETTQCLAAATLGISVLEFHLTLSKYMSGPDVKASLEPERAKYMIKQLRDIECMCRIKVDKEIMAADLEPVRKCFFKSVVAKVDIAAGTVLKANMLSVKKPGTGIPPKDIDSLVGKKAKRSIWAGKIFSYADLEH